MDDGDLMRCTIIVVNWNGGAYVLECLESLVGQTAPGADIEVLVVDNASSDGSDREIESRWPQVRLLRTGRNLGFAGGAEAGLRASEGDVVVLVNNDAVAHPGFVAALLEPLRADPRVAAVTGRIVLAGDFVPAAEGVAAYVNAEGDRWMRSELGGTTLLNSTGNLVSTSGNGRDRSWLIPVDDDVSPPDVFGFCGGAAALRRSAVATAGGFDRRLFMYYEDTDLSWRLRRFGYTIRYASGAVTVHRHAASSGVRSRFFIAQNVRNRILVAARNAPAAVLRAALVRSAGGAAKASLALVREGLSADARARFSGTWAGLLRALVALPRYRASGRRLDARAMRPREFVDDWLVRD